MLRSVIGRCVLLLAVPALAGKPQIDADVIFAERNPGAKGGHYYSNFGYQGRNMDGIKRGDIKKLLVLEDLSKPANYHGGGSTPIAHGGSWSLKRILGTVPVADDGSAYFEVPPMRSLYLALLDADDRSIKQMRSFMTLQPGEQRGCLGCHEAWWHNNEPIREMADAWPSTAPAKDAVERRCAGCHGNMLYEHEYSEEQR